MSNPVRFAIVGSGWRSEFFLRIAQAVPEHFEVVGVLARTQEAASRITSRWGVHTVATISELLGRGPEFVIASVSWESMPLVVQELVDVGAQVLSETPPAPDLEGLRGLWNDVGTRARVQVAEQYLLMPGHAARLAVANEGVIGVPTGVEVASTHLYHAVSMIRGFLSVGLDDVLVNARTFEAPLLDPLTPQGWVDNPRPRPIHTTVATVDFGEGKMGLYNFVDNQWWNPLRARRLVIRGSLVEIVEVAVTRMTNDGPVTSPIVYRRTGVDMNLEGNDLIHASFDGKVIYRNPFIGTRLSEDDIAVAAILEAMGRWTRDEAREPYPLAQACQDHAIGLAIERSAREGMDVVVSSEPWSVPVS